MNWICKRLSIVYLPPAIDSSCCNWFPNSDDLLWMVYYWRKKNGRSRVRDHMWNIYAWLPIIPRLCRFSTPSFNVVEKVRLWWRMWVWPLQNHPSWWWMWRRHGVVITSDSLSSPSSSHRPVHSIKPRDVHTLTRKFPSYRPQPGTRSPPRRFMRLHPNLSSAASLELRSSVSSSVHFAGWIFIAFASILTIESHALLRWSVGWITEARASPVDRLSITWIFPKRNDREWCQCRVSSTGKKLLQPEMGATRRWRVRAVFSGL